MRHIDKIKLFQLKQPLRTRFAPSPTGDLHLGHVLSAIWVWGIADLVKAKVIIRMEDHDQGRCRKHFEDNIIEDLKWLGFLSHPQTEQSPIYTRQSDRFHSWLKKYKQIESYCYKCQCSRSEIQEMQDKHRDRSKELKYYNSCRDKAIESEENVGLRVVLPSDTVEFEDILLGKQTQNPQQQCGDILLKERNGYWTYHFGVCVDDQEQNINLIIRGEDILESTGRQILLSRIMGRDHMVTYLHHPLLLDDLSGKKLSKSNKSLSIRELRQTGYSAQNVLDLAAQKAGLISINKSLNFCNLGELFKWEN